MIVSGKSDFQICLLENFTMGSVTPEEAVADAMQLYDQQGCLHEQFVRQAKALPEAVAVVSHNGMKVRNCVISFFIH